MKVYSFSLVALALSLAGLSFLLPDPSNNVNPVHRVSRMQKVHLSPISEVFKPLTTLGNSYAGNGYHNYGTYTIDVSNRTPNSLFTLAWSTYIIPNRFTLSNGSTTNYGLWQGTGNWPCQWGPGSNPNQGNTGYMSINIGTAKTLTLMVESCNATPASNVDQWDVNY